MGRLRHRPVVAAVHRHTAHRGVTVVGVQHDDGTVGRLVAVHCDDELTPAAARKLAAAITTAADESTSSHSGGASFAPAARRAGR